MAAIQESRCEQGMVVTGGFISFVRGLSKGILEKSFGLRQGMQSLTRETERLVTFTKERFCVRHADPRQIFVNLTAEGTKLLFVSLHAPHRATEAHLIRDWWFETRRLCNEMGPNRLVLIGVTLTPVWAASCHSVLGAKILTCRILPETLCISCFRALQVGYRHPFRNTTMPVLDIQTEKKRGQTLSRIDFIVLPLAWRNGEIASRVALDSNAGQPFLDHVAVLCDVKVMNADVSKPPVKQRRRLDAKAIADPADWDVVRQLVASAPAVPWHVSSHVHAAILFNHLQERLSSAFPTQQHDNGHRFLSSKALEIRAEIGRVRRACCRLRSQVRQQLPRVAIRVWRSKGTGPDVNDFLASPLHKQALLAGACHTAKLSVLALSLKKHCHDDRVRYMEGLADQVAQAPLGQAAVHSLLGHKRKVAFSLNGQMCSDGDQIRLR